MLPDTWLSLPELPLSSNGKVDRAALLWLLQEQRRGIQPQSAEPPQGEWEEALAALWQELLHVPQVGRHQGFSPWVATACWRPA